MPRLEGEIVCVLHSDGLLLVIRIESYRSAFKFT
jgi:hypothetical protein